MYKECCDQRLNADVCANKFLDLLHVIHPPSCIRLVLTSYMSKFGATRSEKFRSDHRIDYQAAGGYTIWKDQVNATSQVQIYGGTSVGIQAQIVFFSGKRKIKMKNCMRVF